MKIPFSRVIDNWSVGWNIAVAAASDTRAYVVPRPAILHRIDWCLTQGDAVDAVSQVMVSRNAITSWVPSGVDGILLMRTLDFYSLSASPTNGTKSEGQSEIDQFFGRNASVHFGLVGTAGTSTLDIVLHFLDVDLLM